MAGFQFSGAHGASIGAGDLGLAEALSNRNLLRIITIAVVTGGFLLFMAQVSARPACSKTDAYVAGKIEELQSTRRTAV